MRVPFTLTLFLLPLSLASTSSHWSTLASRSKTGVIKLDAESYEELLATDRDYSVSVVLTALPAQFKCQPCHEFDPAFHRVADSWKRQSQHVRDQHFFAQLDFSDGQAVYQKLGLTSAPTVQFHPALSGPNKGNKLSVITYDLNRNGLTAGPFHSFISHLTPTPFELHMPTNIWPIILTPLLALVSGGLLYGLWPFLLPLIQSRIIWGSISILMILTFTSGYMWNKIKGAPYVSVDQEGRTSWIAGGYQNQLGLESQVVAATYGLLGFTIIALTIFVPAQSSPVKQRIGVYIWLGMLLVVFSLLMKLFKLKNGGYPFMLLF
ncbi:MAG: oligosaccharyl transferase subunit ost3/OST6 [Tremellales sp. Tagirdzhanova-0007]|nr:MAG: oligosaccharyl transferase subunit ost3/OST6 [Tremellales sp. Tagirdzhanova-0007]